MGQVLVRKLGEKALDRLRLQAEGRRLPLESYIRELLEEYSRRPTPAEARESYKNLLRLWADAPKVSDESVQLIRKLREGEDDGH